MPNGMMLPMVPPTAGASGVPMAGAAPRPGSPPPGAALSGLPLAGLTPDVMQKLLLFLAGMGFPELVQNIQKLRSPPGGAKGKGTPGAPGPGASPVPPQLMQLLAQRAALQGMAPQAPAMPGLPPGALPPAPPMGM